jgi:thiol:disulfide interchange protein
LQAGNNTTEGTPAAREIHMGRRGRTVLTAFVILGMVSVVLHHLKTENGTTLQSIEDARRKAQRNHKFLMVEFGADWCSDCRQLSRQLRAQKTQATLAERFMVIPVDVGEFDRHLDIARALGVDLNQGIPAAVFFEPDGAESSPKVGNRKILEYVQETGE